MKERKVSQGEQTGVNQSLPIPEFKASEAMKPLPKTAKETLPSIAKGGLVCQLSPFSHLNVSVEEKGIKCASLGAPPLASPKEVTGKSPIKKKEVPLSPGKPPNILRKTKSSQHLLAESTRSQESIVRKHAQKQKISGITGDNRAPASEKGIKFCKTSDRYLYVHKVSDDCPMGNAELITSPNTPDSSSFASKAQLNKGDAIPSLQVSSVISDLPWNDDSAVFPTSLLVKNENSKLRPTMCAPNVPAPAISNLESQSDPVSSLKISSVYSAKAMSPLFCDSSASKSDSSMSSSSELRASLSVSSETLGKITPVLCCSDGNTSSTILTSNVSSVDGSLKENIGALENLLVTQPPEKPLRRFVLPEYVFMKSTDKLSSKSTLVNLESAKPLSSPAVNPTTTIKVLNMTGSGGYTFSVPISSMKLLQSPASNKTQAPVAIGKAIPVHLARSNSSNDLTKVDCNETKADHEPPS